MATFLKGGFLAAPDYFGAGTVPFRHDPIRFLNSSNRQSLFPIFKR